MQILSVRLKNFKIHQDQYFEFAPGVNAICGENGAGKTSILEAIAWALFDHTDYALEELIRVGSLQAEVAVQFISDWDHRTYEVRRAVSGKTSTYRLYDPALNQQLDYERKGDVQLWLKQHLGISPDTDLAHLFRTAIGVPQGTLTLDFLKTPSERKKIFDAMIKVEDYKATADQCKDLEKYAADQVTATTHQIELLQVELQQRDPYRHQLAQLTVSISDHRQALQSTQEQQQHLEQEWQRLSETAQQIRYLETTLHHQQHQVSLAHMTLKQCQQQLDHARAAQGTLTTYAPDFERYQALEAQLAALQEQAHRRRQLQQEREHLLAAERTLDQDCTRLHLLLERWQALAKELPSLEAQIHEQARLEAELAIGHEQWQLRQQWLHQVEMERTQCQGSQHQAAHLQQARDQALQAAQTLATHQEGYARYLQAEAQLAHLQELRQQREEIRRHWQEERERLSAGQRQEAKLQASYQRRHELSESMAQLEPQIQQQTQWEQRLQELQERLQHSQSLHQRLEGVQQRQHALNQEQERITQHLQRLQGLLPVVEQIPALESQQERLRTQLSRWQAASQFADELTQILHSAQRQRHELGDQRLAWQALLDRYPDLQQWIQRTWQTLDVTLGSLEQILHDVQGQSDPEHLHAQLQEVGSQLSNAYQARQQTARLEEWQQQQQALRLEHEQIQETLADLHWQLDSDTSTRHHLLDIQARLQALGDPRSYYARCQQEYAASARLDQEWQDLQNHLHHIQGSLNHLEQQLAPFHDLEQQQAHWQQLAQQSQPSYQAYVQSQVLAATLPERQQQWQHLQEQIQAHQDTLEHLHRRLEEHHHTWGADLAETIESQRALLKALGDPRHQIQRIQLELGQRPQVEQQHAWILQQLGHNQTQRLGIEAALQTTAYLDQALADTQTHLSTCRPAYTLYLQAQPLAAQLPQCQSHFEEAEQEYLRLGQGLAQSQEQLTQLQTTFDPEHYLRLEQSRTELALHTARLETSLAALIPQQQVIADRLAYLDTRDVAKQHQEALLAEQKRLHKFIKFMRGIYRDAGPRLATLFLESINQTADTLFREILNRPDVSLTWTPEYDIVVQEGASRRRFAMLSGGEQMTAALAVRLALLKTIEDISIAFFDEPTTNMDHQRRRNLAESLGRIRSFEQLFVISHDDSFESLTGNILHLHRE